eukprot:TRINITY_DN2047_c0_g1_i2.p1 TRINITY_DN2047_c0_g1~~TRINITY_DN2047_c0_g1_i2.p1  ORF type:complete len:362 (+),score=43.01 TRINITY_DN2047_c0_g1_i2:93-1178(+)
MKRTFVNSLCESTGTRKKVRQCPSMDSMRILQLEEELRRLKEENSELREQIKNLKKNKEEENVKCLLFHPCQAKFHYFSTKSCHDLPEELIQYILSFLSVAYVLNAALTCKSWYLLAKKNPLTLMNCPNAMLQDLCPRSFLNNITYVELDRCFRFIEEDMRIISQCINLKSLRTKKKIEKKLWSYLSPLKNLEHLEMGGQTEYDLNVISNFSKLKTLSIELCSTEWSKRVLVQALENLSELESLGRLYFGKATLWKMFPVLPKLREIEVHFSEPKAEDILEMVHKLKLTLTLKRVTMTVHNPVSERFVSLTCLAELKQLDLLKLHIAASWPESEDYLRAALSGSIKHICLTRCYLDHSDCQ